MCLLGVGSFAMCVMRCCAVPPRDACSAGSKKLAHRMHAGPIDLTATGKQAAAGHEPPFLCRRRILLLVRATIIVPTSRVRASLTAKIRCG
jgi:hypothetical protein